MFMKNVLISVSIFSTIHGLRLNRFHPLEEDAWSQTTSVDDNNEIYGFSVFDASGNRKGSSSLTLANKETDVDVWLHMGHSKQSLDSNMYSPILATLHDGFTHYNIQSKLVGVNQDHQMLEGIKEAVAKGKRPVLVSVAEWFGKSGPLIKECGENGAFLVLYQSEPGRVATNAMTKNAINSGAKEIWEYSLSNIARYNASELANHGINVRFVPPGYIKDFEVGVDLQDPARIESQIGFMGKMKYRPKPIQQAYSRVLGNSLVERDNVWTKDQLRTYLNTFPIQLNVHKHQTYPRDVNEDVAMESMRISILATNKACIVAAPAEKDNDFWSEFVHIAEVNETLTMHKSLQQDVRACQKETYRKFTTKMNPPKIFQDSGLLWDLFKK